MVKIKCPKCGTIGYSAYSKAKCECEMKANSKVFFNCIVKSFKKLNKK